jgi:hypothetical protein
MAMTLNGSTGLVLPTWTWQAPVPYPDDFENKYKWDENSQTWILLEFTGQ